MKALAVNPEMPSEHMQSPESKSDLELFELAISGDEKAFLALYERLKAGVFRYAYYMTSSRFAAEEVTQEVFLTLLQNRARFNSKQGDLGAFVFGKSGLSLPVHCFLSSSHHTSFLRWLQGLPSGRAEARL